MKSLQVWLMSVVGVVVGLSGVLVGQSSAQPAPPPLQVNLVLNKLTYALGTEAIGLAITIENSGAADIITAKGFRTQPFYLTLTFIDPEGKGIVAKASTDSFSPEPAPPQTLLDGDVFVEVEEVEILPGNFIVTNTVPDARDFYTFTKGGRYTVTATIPIVTYPDISRTEGGLNFADLDSANFRGALESNTVNFVLIGPPSPGDLDEDGDVDNNDIDRLLGDRNKLVSQSLCGQPCDLDNDGAITAVDVRRMMLLCTRPRCATP
jgi:hypothetical protein